MEDVVPGLYEKIRNEFYHDVNNDKEIQEALSENTKASFSDVSLLSRRIGKYASKALIHYYNEKTLPDGKLYWNILERTMIPIMKEVYELVYRMAFNVQICMDKEQNIGIKPVKAPFPEERIKSIMNKLMAVQEEYMNGKG
ncbi:MAG: hypothetical protein HUJ53_04580 [Holdemanella sp.]|nr:hypothetical protein [Holdemanella sp.]